MTKPIEGWVHYHIPTDTTGAVVYQDPYPKNTDPNFMWRPVKITFTDTTAEDLIKDYADDGESTFKQLEKMHDYVESLAPELNGYIELDEGQKIQNALRKDRERIWEELQETTPIIRLKQGGGIEVDLLDIQKKMFGEEK